MVQTSDESSRKTHGEIRGPIKVESVIPQEEQESKGWYWCSEKRALFRHSDWHKSWNEITLVSS